MQFSCFSANRRRVALQPGLNLLNLCGFDLRAVMPTPPVAELDFYLVSKWKRVHH